MTALPATGRRFLAVLLLATACCDGVPMTAPPSLPSLSLAYLRLGGASHAELQPSTSRRCSFAPTASFTVEAWFRAKDGASGTIAAKFSDAELHTSTERREWGIGVDDGKAFAYRDASPYYLWSTQRLVPGRWHHVAAVHDGGGGGAAGGGNFMLRLYLDGKLQREAPSGAIVPQPDVPVLLGAKLVDGIATQHLDGDMLRLVVWRKALSTLDVMAAAAAPLGTTERLGRDGKVAFSMTRSSLPAQAAETAGGGAAERRSDFVSLHGGAAVADEGAAAADAMRELQRARLSDLLRNIESKVTDHGQSEGAGQGDALGAVYEAQSKEKHADFTRVVNEISLGVDALRPFGTVGGGRGGESEPPCFRDAYPAARCKTLSEQGYCRFESYRRERCCHTCAASESASRSCAATELTLKKFEMDSLQGELADLKSRLSVAPSREAEPWRRQLTASQAPLFPNFTEPWKEPRALAVRDAMLHALGAYKSCAWGYDELKPLNCGSVDNFGGTGATIVDALDTIWIMGLEAEWKAARNWVAQSLDFDQDQEVNVFETTIRILGGLLSAYELSSDEVFLKKAVDLGDRLLRAFESSSGLAHSTVNLRTGHAHSPAEGASFSEVATLQLEFQALSYHTHDSKYFTASISAIQLISRESSASGSCALCQQGLYPIHMSVDTGEFRTDNKVSLGARGDSSYEYFLKMALATQHEEPPSHYRRMYDRSVAGITDRLLQRSSLNQLAYVAEMDNNGVLTHKMDHLACFVPGMLALGARGANKQETIQLAEVHKDPCCECLK